MDVAVKKARVELSDLLDDGITVEIVESEPARFLLRLTYDEAACEECILPDESLIRVARNVLERSGRSVSGLDVEHVGTRAHE